MKLHIFTIALDAMPFITRHLDIFEKSDTDWTWHIVHGAANNSGSTKWCEKQQPRLSRDGTAEYLNSLYPHPRVRLYQQQWWGGGKDEMVNAPLDAIQEDCILLEVDADEIWTSEQIHKISDELFFKNPTARRAQFYCRYFVGPDLIVTGDNAYGNQGYEWWRAWRFTPGQHFTSHEPPVLDHDTEGGISRDVTRSMGLVFDHYAYAMEHQVAYKEAFYGYAGALRHWKRLQANTEWPADLTRFFPWAKLGTVEKTDAGALSSTS